MFVLGLLAVCPDGIRLLFVCCVCTDIKDTFCNLCNYVIMQHKIMLPARYQQMTKVHVYGLHYMMTSRAHRAEGMQRA